MDRGRLPPLPAHRHASQRRAARGAPQSLAAAVVVKVDGFTSQTGETQNSFYNEGGKKLSGWVSPGKYTVRHSRRDVLGLNIRACFVRCPVTLTLAEQKHKRSQSNKEQILISSRPPNKQFGGL